MVRGCKLQKLKEVAHDHKMPRRVEKANGKLEKKPFSFPEPTICSVSGGIIRLWYQPLQDVEKFTTSGSECLIR